MDHWSVQVIIWLADTCRLSSFGTGQFYLVKVRTNYVLYRKYQPINQEEYGWMNYKNQIRISITTK